MRHGRRTCHARRPACAACPLNDLCPSAALVSRSAAAGKDAGHDQAYSERVLQEGVEALLRQGLQKCDIHNAYLDAYGKKEGEKKFAKDHDRMH